MIVGDYEHRLMKGAEVKCAYSGCKAKTTRVKANILGRQIPLTFAGTSLPMFEDPPLTANKGADVDPNAVLRVRWDRLTFHAEHDFLGPIQMNLLNHKCGGRVHSLKSGRISEKEVWFSRRPQFSDNGFFPAVNENRIFFEVRLPKWSLIYRNVEPVVNGAIIDKIPPEGIEYEMKEAVTFKSQTMWAPDLTLEECRMAMAVLRDVKVELVELSKLAELRTRVRCRVTNESDYDAVKLALVGDSSAQIGFVPQAQFMELRRAPVEVSVVCDLTAAMAPGVASLCFILVEPFDSQSASILTFDYEELLRAETNALLPAFGASGLVDQRTKEASRRGIALA